LQKFVGKEVQVTVSHGKSVFDDINGDVHEGESFSVSGTLGRIERRELTVADKYGARVFEHHEGRIGPGWLDSTRISNLVIDGQKITGFI